MGQPGTGLPSRQMEGPDEEQVGSEVSRVTGGFTVWAPLGIGVNSE